MGAFCHRGLILGVILAEGKLPLHGKILGHLSTSDLKGVVTKAVAAYNREVREVDILVFQEVSV